MQPPVQYVSKPLNCDRLVPENHFFLFLVVRQTRKKIFHRSLFLQLQSFHLSAYFSEYIYIDINQQAVF